MTKKKNTAADKGGKRETDAVHNAAMLDEARRAAEALGADRFADVPEIDDLFESVERFRTSFEDTMATVDRFVAEANRLSDQLRAIGCGRLADAYAESADLWADVNSPAFQKAATGIVDLVRSALLTRYPTHVLKVEGPLLDRDLAEWGRLCAAQRHFMVAGEDEDDWTPDETNDFHRKMAAELVGALTPIDEQAAKLNPDRVIGAANNRRRGDAGFAAELACMCGAFDYVQKGKRDDYATAQKAIDKAMKGGA